MVVATIDSITLTLGSGEKLVLSHDDAQGLYRALEKLFGNAKPEKPLPPPIVGPSGWPWPYPLPPSPKQDTPKTPFGTPEVWCNEAGFPGHKYKGEVS